VIVGDTPSVRGAEVRGQRSTQLFGHRTLELRTERVFEGTAAGDVRDLEAAGLRAIVVELAF
jgi:hypothetical protein